MTLTASSVSTVFVGVSGWSWLILFLNFCVMAVDVPLDVFLVHPHVVSGCAVFGVFGRFVYVSYACTCARVWPVSTRK